MISNWLSALKLSRTLRKIRAESAFLRDLRERLTVDLKGSRCLVIGSAPNVVVPRSMPGDCCMGVNGSPYAARRLGLADPRLTVISGYTTALNSAKSRATVPIWRGLRTEEVVFVDTGDSEEHARSVLDEAGFQYDRFTKVSKHERAAIMGEVCGIEFGLGDHNERASNGVFAATIAAWCEAREIVMCGFSLQGGHSYIEGDTPRHNLDGDMGFFAAAGQFDFVLKTTSIEIHEACGVPLAD